MSTAIATFGLSYFALAPFKSFNIGSDLDLLELSVFCINGILISLLGDGFRQARQRQDSKTPNTEYLDIVEHSPSPLFVFLRLFLPIVIVIGCAGYFYANAKIRLKQQELQVVDQEAVDFATNSLSTELANMTGDILFLKKLPRLLVAINAPNAVNLDNLAETWAVYMETQNSYNKICWIDETGMEKVRVNFAGGHAYTVPASQLQDKSKRPFFMQTSTLKQDDIYLSRFDLNVEHEQVETPYQPTMRMIMPLFNAAGQRRGIIVINYNGQKLLANLVSSVGENTKHLVMLNREGYFLYSRNAEETWGFMLNQPTTLAKQDEIWSSMKNSAKGSLLTSTNAWLWSGFHPIDIIRASPYFLGKKSQNVMSEDDIFWLAVRRPMTELQAISASVWQPTFIIMALLTFFSLIICIYLSRTRLKIAQLDNLLRKRTKDAESATLAKSQFLANMSHEIRTPMNAILGLAYLLEKTALPSDANNLVRKIRSAGQSLLGIINDILDFSKIESGKLEIELTLFCINDVLDNLSVIMSASAIEKNIELIIDSPPKSIYQLCGDPLRLEQVLINLACNAIKFTESGHVLVRISVTAEDDKSVSIRFSISDTGIGISPEQQQEIFSPFAQADSSIGRRFGGTGLGLAISRQLVAKMGGQLQVTSVPGVGSEFWFVLTFERRFKEWLATPEMNQLTVLIADDNSVSREALCAIVSSLGWQSSTVSSGEAVIEHLQNNQQRKAPRVLLLLDYKISGMNGLAMAKSIRHTCKETDDLIILMVSSYAKNQLSEHPDLGLVDVVLTKPITPSSLYNAVAQAMQARQADSLLTPVQSYKLLPRLRMLIVDDSEINREVAQRIFVGEGASVVLANDGQQAVDWLQAHPTEVDVVLMDVQMPVMNGYEATRQIRQIPALAELPVIALTAGAFMEQKELANAAGMNGFIAKPFDVGVAIALISKLTGWTAEMVSVEDLTPDTMSLAMDQDLPGLAVNYGLSIWKDALVYQQYLRKFVRDYADSVQVITGSEKIEAAVLAHKLKGAAGSLALQEVSALAGEVVQTLHADEDPADSLIRLKTALNKALKSIERYAPLDFDAENVQLNPIDAEQLVLLFAKMLAALNTDSMLAVRPILAELDEVLPATRLIALHLTVDNFDFREGEIVTRTLANDLNILLKT